MWDAFFRYAESTAGAGARMAVVLMTVTKYVAQVGGWVGAQVGGLAQ